MPQAARGVRTLLFGAALAARAVGAAEEDDVRAADAGLRAALAACDGPRAAGYLDDTFLWTVASGRRMGRDAAIERPCVAAPAASELDGVVRVYGELALVMGVRPGADTAPAVRFLRVWRRSGTSWRALAIQETRPRMPAGTGAGPSAGGGPRPSHGPPEVLRADSASREVAAAYEAMEAAIVANDVAAWTPLVADEFLLIGQRYTGRAVTKAERIATLEKNKAAGTKSTPARMRSLDVRIFGTAALMTSEQVAQDGSGALSRGTRVWVKRDGRWQLVISQQTPVEP